MKELQISIPTDTWVTASWDEYIELVSNPIYDKAKRYYHQGQLEIEMSPVGHDHSASCSFVNFCRFQLSCRQEFEQMGSSRKA